MKTFCFTIDDNIRFLKELTAQKPGSMFDHPYLAMLRRLHERFDLKIQPNLFYRMEGFALSQMKDSYADEWDAAASWLKLSFHSELENPRPYLNSDYEEVFADCHGVHKEILRFAGLKSLGKTTTVHCCQTTPEGVTALFDNGVRGLLGLYGNEESPRTSYSLPESIAAELRNGKIENLDGMTHGAIDMIINTVKLENISANLTELFSRESLRVMIHEQYFYEDYIRYQPDFEEKLVLVFSLLREQGYQSCFFEEQVKNRLT